MRLIHIGMSLCLGMVAMAANTVTLKDGRVITGIYLGGSAREVKIEAGDQIQTLDVATLSRIEFGSTEDRQSRRPPQRLVRSYSRPGQD